MDAGVKTLALAVLATLVVACDKSNDATATPTAPSTAPAATSAPVAIADASPPANDDPLGALLGSGGPVIREEKDVVVDGVTEKWRLEWAKPPVPDCVSDTWSTCACAGWAFGEKGDLDLVRAHPGAADEHMRLDPLFADQDSHLRRWKTTKADEGKKPNIADLAMRPVDGIMKFGDYDHDGRATEFVLVVGSTACGHTPSIVVGISKTDPKLHAFAVKPIPGKASEPVTLDHPADWEKLKAKPSIDVVQVACGDHGADQEESLSITADGELHVKTTTKKCP